ncbi:MAG TPA: hypothetical protein VN578_13855 [Candidatus Binatia bacterium]|jgi:hypothetical protein|nr:hypothetical protein [Candidatus Binatia bacterium]
MKILHLPFNVASQISITVRGLRALGVQARGLARRFSPIQDYSGIETMDWFGKPAPASRLWRGLRWRLKMMRLMAWADLIHWHWGGTTWRGMDLRLAAWLRKPRLVEFWGDDVRDPRVASRDNPALARMYEQNPELTWPRSQSTQRMFGRFGFQCLIPGYELSDYLDAGAFAGYYQTQACLMLEDYEPRYPDASQARPLVVHAPSDKAKKGTEAVLSTLDNLARTHTFDFKLIHQIPRSQALKTVAECDLFLDQFTIGAEGLASHEALALGKPVVCFIKPALRPRYPDTLPIVAADQTTLTEAIAPLLKNGRQRHDLGIRGRQYIEQYHDARKVAAGLIDIYKDLTDAAGNGAPLRSTRSWRPLTPPRGAKGVQ